MNDPEQKTGLDDGPLLPSDLTEAERLIAETGAYVARERVGTCMACGRHEDLRYGCCFECADHVLGDALHHLWDGRDPSKSWFCDDHQVVVDPLAWIDQHVKAK